jgi:hypothetical protein
VWQEKGRAALERVAVEQPSVFIRVAADLIPAHFKVDHEHTLMLNKDKLRARLLELRAQLIQDGIDPELLAPPLDSNG